MTESAAPNLTAVGVEQLAPLQQLNALQPWKLREMHLDLAEGIPAIIPADMSRIIRGIHQLTDQFKGHLVTYVLECQNPSDVENSCWYVGVTVRLPKRLIEHFKGNNNAAEWTRIRPPLRLHQIYPGNREDETTLDLMALHGTTRVRGGSFCTIKSPRPQIRAYCKRRGLVLPPP